MRDSNRPVRFLFLALSGAALLAWSGCAASQSSESVSDSIGSFSDSSGSFSDSSTSSSGDDTAYRGDVEAYTAAHVARGGTPETLRSGLSEVALARGISDWEALNATFVAVGAGLQRAGIPQAALADFQQALTTPGSEASRSVVRGFEAAATAPR